MKSSSHHSSLCRVAPRALWIAAFTAAILVGQQGAPAQPQEPAPQQAPQTASQATQSSQQQTKSATPTQGQSATPTQGQTTKPPVTATPSQTTSPTQSATPTQTATPTTPAGQTQPAPGAAQSAPPQGAAPQTAPAQTTPAQTTPAQPAAQPGAPAATGFDYLIPNASLTEFIDIMARRLKINYILDPGVKSGSVSLYTYGDVKPVDLMTLLETVLRVNGDAIVKVGDLYRIIPINKISPLPIPIDVNIDRKNLPDDERMVLDLIFLKYALATEVEQLIKPFLGEGAGSSTYAPANLLILQDNARSMKRTLQLIELFDSDTFASQRVKLFEVTNARPTDLAKELDTVFKAYAMSDKAASVKFVPIDRINTIIAVAPNPGIFVQVQNWMEKLDVEVKTQAGEVSDYAYRLKYQRAETVAMAIMALYTGDVSGLMQLANQQMMGMGVNGLGFGTLGGGMGGGYGGMGGGYGGMGGGYGGMGGGYGGMGGGYGGGGYGGYGGYGGGGYGGYGGGGYGGGGYGGGYGNYGAPYGYNQTAMQGPPSTAGGAAALTGRDQTGSYLSGGSGAAQQAPAQRMPRVIPNPMDNTLLIQGTQQDYDRITKLLRQLDVPPRQVLIEAKIYEVDVGTTTQYGINNLELTAAGTATTLLQGAVSGAGLGLSMGLLQTRTRELLASVQAQEATNKAKSISAPSIIATDSIPATVNVGTSVPTLSSQAVIPGVQSGGSNPFYNTVSNVSTGVTLGILARVNPAGIVTMVINQDVSAPQSNTSSGINSPSFSNRSFQTQVTVQDGEMIAIGGGIIEQDTDASSGVPFLQRIPFLGSLFGSKNHSRSRSELVMFITPHVIYNSDQLLEASDEVTTNLKKLKSMIKGEQQ